MTMLRITAGPFAFTARMEEEAAPQTCKVFRRLLPFRNRTIHVRWSGEGIWIPLGDVRVELPFENHTSHPSKGEILFYPGGLSEAEIILAYGGRLFRKQGRSAGGEPLPDDRGGDGKPAGARQVCSLGRRSGNPIRTSLLTVCLKMMFREHAAIDRLTALPPSCLINKDYLTVSVKTDIEKNEGRWFREKKKRKQRRDVFLPIQ